MTLPNVQSIEERRASKVNEIKHLYAFEAKLIQQFIFKNFTFLFFYPQDLSGRRMSMEDYDKPNIRRLSLTGAS